MNYERINGIVIIGIILTKHSMGQIGITCTSNPSVCDTLANGECSDTFGICFCITGFIVDEGGCHYDCGSLTHPTNGYVTTSDGVTTGDLATYACDPGYQLTGLTTRQCLENEGWNGTEPTCDPGCVGLTNPLDGSVVTSLNASIGSTANYSCDAGFKLTGTAFRTCIENLGWDSPAPTCTAGILNDDCSSNPNLCDNLVTAECNGANCVCISNYTDNGSGKCIEDCGSPTSGAVFTPAGTGMGKFARYYCDPGYTLNGTTTRQCLENTGWDETAPACIEIDLLVCDSPEGSKIVWIIIIAVMGAVILVLIVAVIVLVVLYNRGKRNAGAIYEKDAPPGNETHINESQGNQPQRNSSMSASTRANETDHVYLDLNDTSSTQYTDTVNTVGPTVENDANEGELYVNQAADDPNEGRKRQRYENVEVNKSESG